MKLINAWSQVTSQNVTLRFVICCLAICTFALAVCSVRLALKDPLVIERECFSRMLTPADPKHTAAEIENFIRVALPKRFDTRAQDAFAFLSPEERNFRNREQDDLSKKGITQRCFVNTVKVDGNAVTVDADRVISVGKIKSALAFPLTVTLASTDRTPANPYGLVLQRVSAINTEENKNEKK